MDNLATILVALLAAAVVGFIIYRIAVKSGSSAPRATGDRPSTRNPFDNR